MYFQDRIVPSDDLHLDIKDRGFLLGDGLFETIHSFSGSIPYLLMHWDRLNAGLSVLDIPRFLSFELLETAVEQVLKANKLERAEATLRLTVTRGAGPRGLLPPESPSPRLFLTACPYQAPKKEAFSAIIASIRRNEYSPLSRIKSLCYLDNVLAKQEAFKSSKDEALLLNSKGKIVGASAANVFFLKGGKLFTSDINEGTLAGVTRQIIIEVAQKIDLAIVFEAIEIRDLPFVQEAFLSNSLLGVMPLVEIDGLKIGDGEAGDLTMYLKKKYDLRSTEYPIHM
ncbi:MAG: branched-chain amino acid aminotransferase [Chlamydiales bacterium]